MSPQQHYHLKIADLSAELLSVESFTLHETLGRPFVAGIPVAFTRQDIDLASLLDRYPRLSIHGPTRTSPPSPQRRPAARRHQSGWLQRHHQERYAKQLHNITLDTDSGDAQ